MFMTAHDEDSFSTILKARFPKVAFVESITSGRELVERHSISECTNRFGTISIWNRDASSELPCSRRTDGDYEWATNGPALQFIRCRVDGPLLVSGTIGAGVSEKTEYFSTMDRFIKSVWRILRSQKIRLRCIDPATGKTLSRAVVGYSVWPGVAGWCTAEPERLLKDMGTFNYYLPVPERPENGKQEVNS